MSSHNRLASIKKKKEEFLALAEQTEKAATQSMRTVARDLLLAAFDGEVSKLRGGWIGPSVDAALIGFSKATKNKNLEHRVVNDLRADKEKINALSARLTLASEKLGTLCAEELFTSVKILRDFGMTDSINYILYFTDAHDC